MATSRRLILQIEIAPLEEHIPLTSFDPNLWTLIGFVISFPEIVHTLTAQEHQRSPRAPCVRRVVAHGNLVRTGFWAFVGRIVLCLGLLWFAGVWGCRCPPPFSPIKIPHKHKQAIFTKMHNSRLESFDVKVDVYFHGVQKPLHVNHAIGDGNCYWRAVAKQTKYSWHRLKKLTINYMRQHAQEHQGEALLQETKQLQEKNAWANSQHHMPRGSQMSK